MATGAEVSAADGDGGGGEKLGFAAGEGKRPRRGEWRAQAVRASAGWLRRSLACLGHTRRGAGDARPLPATRRRTDPDGVGH